MENNSTVKVWCNARLATLAEGSDGLGVIDDGLIAAQAGRIVFAGPRSQAPDSLRNTGDWTDCGNRWITPGLIDCHTHLVYAGNRSGEFELRLRGATYADIAQAGGGIAATVAAVRNTSEAAILAETLPRLKQLMAEGVTTVEIKSGYGLDLENERKLLRAARQIGSQWPITVRTSFLGAHAMPPGGSVSRAAYIGSVAGQMLPMLAAEGLADAVDGFCEGIGFSPDEIATVFDAARKAGLPVKLHADQLSDLGGAALAARYGALSADHLEYTNEDGAAALAQAGTVAVILPGAFYFLRETKAPPIAAFRRHGVAMAVATDCNPGTSPLSSLLLAMNMAATQFRMTVDECIAGVTREAARALGLLDETGTLESGKWADLAIWDIERPADLVYRIGYNPLFTRVWRGQ